MQNIQVLEWSDEQVCEAALLRCELAQAGQPIGHYDTLIAAHALLIEGNTHNMEEFGQVKGFWWRIGKLNK